MGDGLGLEVEIIEAAVAVPGHGETGVSSEEADDVESDILRNTSPSEEGPVGEGTSTTPGGKLVSLGTLSNRETTPDTSSLGDIF